MVISAREPQKRFLRALHGLTVDRPPFWYMRQAGRYLPEYRAVRATAPDFVAFCLDPEKSAKVTLQPIERYQMDAAILFADILLIPHGLGQRVRFLEGEGPRLDAITNTEELSKLNLDHLNERLSPIYETVRKLAKTLPQETALIGFAGAPWTVATYMVGGQGSSEHKATRLWGYKDPIGFGKLIDLITEATIIYLRAQIDAGAEVIQIFDTWAGSLPEDQQKKWVIAPTAQITAALKASHPSVPIIGFPKGIGAGTTDYAAATGIQAIGLDITVPAEWARDHLQGKVAVQGNLDPLLLVAGGDAMIKEAERLLRVLGPQGYIFNLGHGIVPETPPDHVAQLSRLIRDWRP